VCLETSVRIKQIFVSNFHTVFAVRFLEPFFITHRSQWWNFWLMLRFLKVVQDHKEINLPSS